MFCCTVIRGGERFYACYTITKRGHRMFKSNLCVVWVPTTKSVVPELLPPSRHQECLSDYARTVQHAQFLRKTVPKLLTPKQKISRMNIFERNRSRFRSIRHSDIVTNRGFSYTVLKQSGDVDERVQTRHDRKKQKRVNQISIFVWWSFSLVGGGIVYVHWAPDGQTRRFCLAIVNERMDEDARICGRTSRGFFVESQPVPPFCPRRRRSFQSSAPPRRNVRRARPVPVPCAVFFLFSNVKSELKGIRFENVWKGRRQKRRRFLTDRYARGISEHCFAQQTNRMRACRYCQREYGWRRLHFQRNSWRIKRFRKSVHGYLTATPRIVTGKWSKCRRLNTSIGYVWRLFVVKKENAEIAGECQQSPITNLVHTNIQRWLGLLLTVVRRYRPVCSRTNLLVSNSFTYIYVWI